MSLSRTRDSGMALGDMALLQTLDPNTQVLTQPWVARGLVGQACAPRQMVSVRTDAWGAQGCLACQQRALAGKSRGVRAPYVAQRHSTQRMHVPSRPAHTLQVLLRSWRQEKDGTYIVLYQSTQHRRAQRHAPGGWLKPVQAQVQAAGFTIAPLLPRYTSEQIVPRSCPHQYTASL